MVVVLTCSNWKGFMNNLYVTAVSNKDLPHAQW